MKTGTKIGLAALLLAVATTFTWFYMTRTVGVPDNRTGFVVAFLSAIGLGLFAFVRGTSIPGAVPPALALVMAGFLTFTIYISPQALDSNSAIKVGDTIPDFTALNGKGETFDSRSLQGHLVLIKFFRAHW